MKCAYIEKKSFMDGITLTKCKRNYNLCRISLVFRPVYNVDSSLLGCDIVSLCRSFLKFLRTVVPSSSCTSSQLAPWRCRHYYSLKTETHSATLLWELHICLVYHLWRHFRKYSLCITFITNGFRERRSPRGHRRLQIIVQTGPD
jgi:hypothetical protein